MRPHFRDDQPRKRSLFRRLNSWQAVFTIVSLGIGILGILLTILTQRQPEPGVTFETISDTNVLDLHRPLQDLNIVFRGQNIQERNLHLRIVTINIVNSGEIDILPNHYDHEDDWGVNFKGGEVIEARLVDASSNYLRSKVVPRRLGVDSVTFPKVIFEKGDYFAIEVLLLHPKNNLPSVSFFGKIAGVREVPLIIRSLAREDVGFLEELFRGNAVVQVVRMIVYWFGTWLVLFAAIIFLLMVTTPFNMYSSRRRKARILATRTIGEMSHSKSRDLLVDHYGSSSESGLKELQDLCRDPRKIKWVAPPTRWIVSDGEQLDDAATANMIVDVERRRSGSSPSLDALMTAGVLKMGDDDHATIDSAFLEAVDSLLAELEK